MAFHPAQTAPATPATTPTVGFTGPKADYWLNFSLPNENGGKSQVGDRGIPLHLNKEGTEFLVELLSTPEGILDFKDALIVTLESGAPKAGTKFAVKRR